MTSVSVETTEPKRIFHQPHPASGFMSRRQVAEEFGFSVGYLNLLPREELPFFKRGGKVFYERVTVIAWIKGEAVAVSPPPKAKEGGAKRGRKPKPPIRSGR